MKRLQAYQFELRPNGEQQRDMRRFAGSCRFVYNKALALQKANHDAGLKYIGYVAMAANLPIWKREVGTEWLNDVPSQALQQTLKDLERAYTNFFTKRADFPRFKKKGRSDSYRYPQGCQLDQSNSRVFLPKLGWLRYRHRRTALGTVKNITVSNNSGKWFMSVQTEREVEVPVSTATSAIGIDVGIKRFATFSNGKFLAPLNSFKKHEQRLAKYQRRLNRKVKFSNNWTKAKARVQRIHSAIANARKDYLHKCSTTISQNHAMVCIEDLQIGNMSKSAKGSIEQPGRKVKQKAGLNKAILDQGWFEFRRQLDYKLDWNGGTLLAVPPHHTSQTCPCCGHVSKDNRTTQARFACVSCGYENHADVVGAINILSRGMQILQYEGQDTADASAGRETVAPIACPASDEASRRQQEPTEATVRELAHA